MDNCNNCRYEDCMWKFEWGDKCHSYKRKPFKTEYAVELMREHNNGNKFIRQVDVFDTYEEACEFADNYKEPLADDEYLNIIFIDYNENGDEIEFGTVC